MSHVTACKWEFHDNSQMMFKYLTLHTAFVSIGRLPSQSGSQVHQLREELLPDD